MRACILEIARSRIRMLASSPRPSPEPSLDTAKHLPSSRPRVQSRVEARNRLGGTIRTNAREGFVTEGGPNGFLDREPAMKELVGSLGLSDRLRRAGPSVKRRFIFARGALREVPFSPPAFLKSNLLPL